MQKLRHFRPNFAGLCKKCGPRRAVLFGFAFAQKNIEIRGRLTDPALLPVYIGRLNAEPAFAGRRFAALDMKGVEPAPASAETPAAPPARAAVLPRHTEFVLRTEPEAAK